MTICNGSAPSSGASGLPVDLSADTPSVCDLTDNSWFAGVSSATVHLNHAGRCILSAQQMGNSTYNPSASLSQFFNVNSDLFLFLPMVENK